MKQTKWVGLVRLQPDFMIQIKWWVVLFVCVYVFQHVIKTPFQCILSLVILLCWVWSFCSDFNLSTPLQLCPLIPLGAWTDAHQSGFRLLPSPTMYLYNYIYIYIYIYIYLPCLHVTNWHGTCFLMMSSLHFWFRRLDWGDSVGKHTDGLDSLSPDLSDSCLEHCLWDGWTRLTKIWHDCILLVHCSTYN